ncbi:hypothetical protein [Liberiplasma polymorphum]|uniref:hypothetical protein n=1 Tax=Liberiplasma polymorphum TaxID=3374570 RepID=UPI003772CD14
MKTDNLLLGNGVNLTNSNYLSSKEIVKRIEKTLQSAIYFLGTQNNIVFLTEIKNNFDFTRFSGNVEELLFECFKLVITKRESYFKKMTEKRFLELLTLLKRVFINAMFVENNELIKVDIPKEIVYKIKNHKKILSTNYYEYWDDENITIHLHGKIDFIPFDKNDYTIEEDRMMFDIEYASAIDDMFIEKYHFPIESLDELIMLPVGYQIDKNEVRDIENKYTQFGFMLLERTEKVEAKDIYADLDSLNEITLYGISPVGDELLMNKLAKIPVVIIYVYDIVNNKEANIWKSNIPHATLFDSKEF